MEVSHMKLNAWISGILTAAMLLFILTACGAPAESAAASAQSAAEAQSASEAESAETAETEPEVWDIILNGDSAESQEAAVKGSAVIIGKGGVYRVTGTLNDGQIIVSTKDEDVTLILGGADITCSTGAPIYVKKTDHVYIELEEGTENTITDGAAYALAEGVDEPDAAIFSKDDLYFQGTGTLTVNGNYAMAIHSKDTLGFRDQGTYHLSSPDDCVKGKDAVYISDCTMDITAGGDGINANNDAEGGSILIESGSITVDAQGDGIKAAQTLEIAGGTLNVTAQQDGLKAKNSIGGGELLIRDGEITLDVQQDGIQSQGALRIEGGSVGIITLGGSANAPAHKGDFFGGPPGWFNDVSEETETASAKGLKSLGDTILSGGSVNIDSYDDAIHSDASVTISGDCQIEILAGDDAVHANDHLTIEGGSLHITHCYEGLEALFIDILDGDVYLKSDDDGMNANGEERFGPMGNMMGIQDTLETANCYLHIAGGHVVVDASGDGLDSNGFLFIEGGETYVHGPARSMNGALDCGSSAQVDGGTVMALGISGMDENFGVNSLQPSMKCKFAATIPGDAPMQLLDSSGNVLVEFQLDLPEKSYNSVVVSCPDLTVGETYTMICGDETVQIELTDTITTVSQRSAGSPETYVRSWGPPF